MVYLLHIIYIIKEPYNYLWWWRVWVAELCPGNWMRAGKAAAGGFA